MTQTKGRSSSLQRSGSAKRGQRANTPRRLSDLQERPAWDATSSNLDRFKLTSEEQERRRASRVSRNRLLATSDSKRSFVEAWAKHVSTSGIHSDIEPEQDRNRSSSVSRGLPGIDYGSVVEMLRKSPAAARMSPSVIAALSKDVAALPPPRHSSAASVPVTTSFGTDGATDDKVTVHSEPRTNSGALLAAEASAPTMAFDNSSFMSAAAAPASHSSNDRLAAMNEGSAGVGAGAAAASITGGRRSTSAAAAAAAAPAAARGGNPGSATREAELADDDDKGDVWGSGGSPLYRADISITPAAPRPRFNPADATTIIEFGEASECGEDAVTRSNSCSPGYVAAAGAAEKVGGGGDAADPVTAAFEAALFSRGSMGAAAQHNVDSSTALAWANSRDVASPLDAAALDVERRLRAVEASLGLSRRAVAAGRGGDQVLQEELAELRRELRQVQKDNTKLRQELSTFSTHASALMTQLQAQVQQLLRGPAFGSSDGGASIAAAETALPSNSSSRLSHPGASRPHQQAIAAGARITTASIPTTVAAAHRASAAAGSHAPFADFYLSHPVPQPHQSVPQPYQSSEQALLPTQSQQIARRNIFADIDIFCHRPMGVTASVLGSGEATPLTATQRPAGGHTPSPTGAAAVAASPLIDIASVPSALYKVPVRDIDDSEVALPPFAAFKRSTGTLAFTAAKPAANGATSVPFTPNPPTHGANAAPDPPRLSPPGSNSNIAAVQPRPLPTHYQPRSIGGVIVRPGSNPSSTALLPATSVGMTAAAAAGGANAVGGAYISSLTATATAAITTGSDSAAAVLARTHSGMPQPLMFSVAPEFRTARATGLSAENSMSLFAHTAAAASLRSKASVPAAVGGAR